MGYDLILTQPTDLVNQSIPFSFLSVEFSTNDGQPHQAQLYTGVSEDGSSIAIKTSNGGRLCYRRVGITGSTERGKKTRD